MSGRTYPPLPELHVRIRVGVDETGALRAQVTQPARKEGRQTKGRGPLTSR